MKRKSLILFMTLILGLPWMAMAQNTITLSGNVTQTIAPNTTYNFYDSGGSSSNYSNDENYTATLTCVGDITINFAQFTTESSSGCSDYDHMHIYDGSANTGILLARGQTGCTSATLTTGIDYVATSGTMTIVWKSDGSSVAAGWAATITGGAAPSCPKPVNLTAITGLGDDTKATLSWTENGSANNWVLQYGTNSDFTSGTYTEVTNDFTTSGTTIKKALTGLTAGTKYYARVKADCGGGDQSDWSSTIEFTPTTASFIGNGTSTTEYFPLYGNYNYSYDQMIYTATQLQGVGIDMDGSITKIAFNSSASNANPRETVIYMGHTTKTSFNDANDFVAFADLTKVYDYANHSTWSIDAGWNEFELDTPFEYDGTSNLVIAMYCHGTYKTTSFYYTSATDQALYARDDNKDPNPSTYDGNWSDYSGSKAKNNNLPNLKMYFEPASSGTVKPLPYSYGFENNDLAAEGWTAVTSNNNSKITTADDAPEGSYLFRFNYHEDPGYLVSPMLSGTENGVYTSFYYMNSSTSTSYTEQFQVGYTTDASNTDPSTFTYDPTISGQNSWNLYEKTFPANTKRIAIKYIYTNGLYLRLDDFHFSAPSSSSYITTITNKADWEEFCDAVNGGHDYAGEIVEMTADAGSASDPVTKMAGTVTGTSVDDVEHVFAGTFKGNGHTVYINVTGQSRFAAPFRCVNGATISNVRTAGTISGYNNSDGKILAGVVGVASGTTTVIGCSSSATITTNKGEDSDVCGIVASYNGTLTVEGCAFTGSLAGGTSNTKNGGLVGYRYSGSCTVKNSIFAPSSIGVSTTDNTYSATIARTTNSATPTITNCYYTSTLGKVQGQELHTITAGTDVTVAMSGTATEYLGSGITAYTNGSTQLPGLLYNGTIIAGSEDQVSLTLGGSSTDTYEANHGALTGSGSSWTLTMDAYDTEITAVTLSIIYDINNDSDWNMFAMAVRNGHDYSGETVHLLANVSITSQDNQAGSEGKLFKGTFEGHGNTITVDMTATGKNCAPFFGVQNAHINDLVVTGSITSDYTRIGGISGVMEGDCTYTNCLSNVNITSTNSGEVSCGGFNGFSGGGANPTFVGCAFTGSITAAGTACAGFIGFHASRSGWAGNYGGVSTYTNCFLAPSSINMSNTTNAVFTCGYTGGQYVHITVTNSYYNEEGAELNLKQDGKRAYTVTGDTGVTVARSGSAAGTYTVSGITAYSTGLNFTQNNTTTIYGAQNDQLGLTLSAQQNGVFYVEDGNGTLTQNGDNYTLTMPNANVVVKFGVGYTITATANPAEGGTIMGAGDFVSGRTCTLVATANRGYVFTNWTKDGVEVSTNASYSFTVSEDAAYVANFTALAAYQITATVTPAGAGTVTGADTYYDGESCILVATPISSSYAFINWTQNGIEVSTDATYTFTVSEDAAYVANFMEIVCDYFEDFNSYTGTAYDAADNATDVTSFGWNIIFTGTNDDYEPHVATGIYSSRVIHDGNGFCFTSGNSTYGSNNYAILPEFDELPFFISLRYRYESSSAGTLTLGTISDATDENTFIALYDITPKQTSQSSLWQHAIDPTAVEGKRLAFRWSHNSSYYTCGIDDVCVMFDPNVTLTKTIESYENSPSQKGGYYLIASPLAADVDPATVGMITADEGENENLVLTYDFYRFNQNQTLEWENYRVRNFDLVNGRGYLYASKNGTTITFTGIPYSGNGEVALHVTDSVSGLEFSKWNLVGNPFAQDAYLSDSRSFYSLQNSDEYIAKTGLDVIEAMEGVFVIAEREETLTFTTTRPGSKIAQLNLNLTKGNSLMDRAIVRFDEGGQLPKMQFRKGSTKVYIPQEGKDYAVVSSESMGTMPVNFKAENDGSYTLSFNAEEVSFAYLHLIDNMTGIETDLLANPSYTFDARTTDYESRFKLVFATGNNANDDNFAFFSNGSFVINNEGEATLQVIDINGRILKSESINGCANVNVKAAAGVYMLRLVNGNDVKVQKVVVR